LVIAGGQGYVVDAHAGALVREPPWCYAYSAIPVPGHTFVLVADTTEIWAVYRDRDVTASRRDRAWYDTDSPSVTPSRVALDGIVFDAPGRDAITGAVWEMDGLYAFTLHFDGLRFERGALLTTESDAIYGSLERGGFPPSPAARAVARELAI
jgi:hypothetical protein